MRRGFSLIEMIAVLTIMSLVMSAVVMRWNGPLQAVKLQSNTERVIDFDFKVRRHATSRHRDCRLVFDLDKDWIEASRWVDAREKAIGIGLGEGIVISEIRTSSEKITEGKVQLNVYADGSTRTYAIKISQGPKQRWIVIAGRTGQSHLTTKTEDIDALFKKMQANGTDAN